MSGILLEVRGAIEAAGSFKRKAERAPRELRNAMRRAATFQARAIKGAIKRSRSGLLGKSIGSKVSEKRKGRLVALAGPRRGFRTVVVAAEKRKLLGIRKDKKGKLRKVILKKGRGVRPKSALDPARYAHLADKGHQKGKGKGAAKGQNFMEAADKATKEPVKQMVREAMQAIAKA